MPEVPAPPEIEEPLPAEPEPAARYPWQAAPQEEPIEAVPEPEAPEELAAGEPVVEEPVVRFPWRTVPEEEPESVEELVVEEPVVEEPVVEEPVVEELAVEEPVVEEPAVEEPVIEEPLVEEPVVEEPVVEEPVIEEPVIEEPAVEEPVVEEPAVEEPVGVALEPVSELTWAASDDPAVRDVLMAAAKRVGTADVVDCVGAGGERLCLVGARHDPQEVFSPSARVASAARAMLEVCGLGASGEVLAAVDDGFIWLGTPGGDQSCALLLVVARGASQAGSVALAGSAASRGLEPIVSGAEPLEWPAVDVRPLARLTEGAEVAQQAADATAMASAAAAFGPEEGRTVVILATRDEGLETAAEAVFGLQAAMEALAETIDCGQVRRVLLTAQRGSVGCALVPTESTLVGLAPSAGASAGAVSAHLARIVRALGGTP